MLSCIIQKIGEHSFTIMATHFMVFKSIDILVNLVFFKGNVDEKIILGFPISFPQIRIVYAIAGIFMPMVGIAIVKKIRQIFIGRKETK